MNTLLSIIKLLPAIIDAVKAAEQFVPISGAGKAKLEFVLGVIQDTSADLGALTETITKVITRIVSLGNATGVLKPPQQ